MKILYVYDKMPSTYQKYLFNLLVLIKNQLSVNVLTYEDNAFADHCVKRYGFRDYFQYLLYKLSISSYKSIDEKYMHNYDIIHLQHSYLWRKLRVLTKFQKSPKIIITLRGGDTYIKPWGSESWEIFYRNSEFVSAFITMSDHQKRYLTRWGVDPEKIHVIPISFGKYSDALPKYPNTKKLKLVSAFRMTWEKNIEGTVRFASILHKKGVPFHYDIYGDGLDLGQLYYLIDKYELNPYITVKGKIDNETLKKELVQYDFFVQLSLSEALPTSILEAQSIGLPCIVSDSGGLPEAVIKGKTAIVHQYQELEIMVTETLTIWSDKALYYSYSQNAIAFVNDNFTLEHETQRLTKLYKELVFFKEK